MCIRDRKGEKLSTSDKIDRIVTNRFLALPIFALVMFIVYYVSITTVGAFLTDWTNDTLFAEWIVPGARTLLENIHCAGWLTGLVVDLSLIHIWGSLLLKVHVETYGHHRPDRKPDQTPVCPGCSW